MATAGWAGDPESQLHGHKSKDRSCRNSKFWRWGGRPAEEGIYFGDRDRGADRTSGVILLNGLKLKPACFLQERQLKKFERR